MTSRLGQVVSSVTDFLSGAERIRPVSPEYLELSVDERAELFLVTYGPYGILPSFDSDCLAAICWLKMCGTSFELEPTNEPEMSPDGMVGDKDGVFMACTIKEKDIRDFGADNLGIALQDHESPVLELLEKSIRPALVSCMSPNEFLTIQMATLWFEKPMCNKVKSEALESLKILSEHLGDQEYFGHPDGLKMPKRRNPRKDGPGYCDAVAYGLFAVALVILPASHELRTMIETCSRLRAFVGRIRREFFD